MDMLLPLLLFIVGVVLIVKGGDVFVDAAAWIAKISGIPKFIIGATIVSLATTLPELIVSAIATSSGKLDMAFGNAIGSVTANTGLILSLSILFLPLVMPRKKFLFKSSLLLCAIAALFILCMDGSLTLVESIVLFVIFALFIYENIKEAKLGSSSSNSDEERLERTGKDTVVNIIKFVLGAAGIVVGSQLLVDNGSDLAARLGVPENVIALTAVAIGTSLPELVTSVTAIIKKETNIGVGNVIGANIIDTTLILPICSFISGGQLTIAPQGIWLDIPVCFLITLVTFVPSLIKQKFYKWQGFLALAIYVVYILYVCFG